MGNWFSSANIARYRHVISGIGGVLVGIIATLAGAKVIAPGDAQQLTDALNQLNTNLLAIVAALGAIATILSGVFAGRSAQPLARAESLEKESGAIVIMPDDVARQSKTNNVIAASDVKAVVLKDNTAANKTSSDKIMTE